MKTTPSKKQRELWKLIKQAIKTMWQYCTNANEKTKSEFHFHEEEPEPSVKQLMQQEDIKGTPFKVVGHQTKGYWIAFGPYRLTEQKPTKHEAKLDLNTEKWNIIARLVAITTDFEKNIKPTLTENSNKKHSL